jgi:hypothetical protein
MPASRFLSGAKSTMASISLANRHGSDADARIVGRAIWMIRANFTHCSAADRPDQQEGDDGIVEMAAGRGSLNEPAFRR